jgi:hypothetical protein
LSQTQLYYQWTLLKPKKKKNIIKEIRISLKKYKISIHQKKGKKKKKKKKKKKINIVIFVIDIEWTKNTEELDDSDDLSII